MWKRVAGYGALLAAGTPALEWLEYQRMARLDAGHIYVYLFPPGRPVLHLARPAALRWGVAWWPHRRHRRMRPGSGKSGWLSEAEGTQRAWLGAG